MRNRTCKQAKLAYSVTIHGSNQFSSSHLPTCAEAFYARLELYHFWGQSWRCQLRILVASCSHTGSSSELAQPSKWFYVCTVAPSIVSFQLHCQIRRHAVDELGLMRRRYLCPACLCCSGTLPLCVQHCCTSSQCSLQSSFLTSLLRSPAFLHSFGTHSRPVTFSQWSPRCPRDFALLGQPSPGRSDGGSRYTGPTALCAPSSFQVPCRQILNCPYFGGFPKSRKNASSFAVPKQSSVPTSNLDHPV